MTQFFIAVYFVLLATGPTMIMSPLLYKSMGECVEAVQATEERLDAAPNVGGYMGKCFQIKYDDI